MPVTTPHNLESPLWAVITKLGKKNITTFIVDGWAWTSLVKSPGGRFRTCESVRFPKRVVILMYPSRSVSYNPIHLCSKLLQVRYIISDTSFVIDHFSPSADAPRVDDLHTGTLHPKTNPRRSATHQHALIARCARPFSVRICPILIGCHEFPDKIIQGCNNTAKSGRQK